MPVKKSLLPKPPDRQCPLEKIRQIGRDLRHTVDCKVTDPDLQDYCQTLSTLLSDPKCLICDPMAKIARAQLDDLQNDRISLHGLGDSLHQLDMSTQSYVFFKERYKGDVQGVYAGRLNAHLLLSNLFEDTTNLPLGRAILTKKDR
ncbi:hypothetical protein DPMN_062722 [Dreissena polymorpha]|uniref:Uncharacterized protein n=1 Tax=Dreissena polymorpha TaxID=45954 RepID=A0A9D4HJK8_DREPO|nr:hypothetical protein DPMN_062722 [Dreissena polymorpha]